jgi:HNH endonuclease
MKYDLATGEGRRVWDACVSTASASILDSTPRPSAVSPLIVDPAVRYGEARHVQPRLGQGTFRVAVTEACGRACAITEEHSLPALEAAHIRSFAEEGPHDVRNGMLFRADFHRLFDAGYVTVTQDLRLEVGSRLKKDFENGRSYYPYHGRQLHLPAPTNERPDPAFLQWHNDHKFLG